MFADQESSDSQLLPERGLLTGVLRRAIFDYLGTEGPDCRDAEYWIFLHSGNATKAEFSFTWICEHLGLDPVRVRSNVKYHKEAIRSGEMAAFTM